MSAKPIKLTADLIRQAVIEFSEAVSAMKMADGKVSYNKNFTYKDAEKAKILFTPTAYAKMISLLMAFDSEVAWHGVGRRLEDVGSFLISDILVYPQTVSGTTVEMDTEEYATWIMDNDEDDRFYNIIMQGHSHVRMGTSPSAVDKTHQEEILEQLSDDKFYIFMIWNKRLEHYTKIFDLKNNILYEDSDVVYGISDDDCDLDEFIKDAKKMVVEKKYSYSKNTPYYAGYNSSNASNNQNKDNKTPTSPSSKPKDKQNGKSCIGNGWKGRGSEDMDPDARDFFNT